jgi:hypothetical protein
VSEKRRGVDGGTEQEKAGPYIYKLLESERERERDRQTERCGEKERDFKQ